MSVNTALKPNEVQLPYYKEVLEKETKETLDFLQEKSKRANEIMARIQVVAAKSTT